MNILNSIEEAIRLGNFKAAVKQLDSISRRHGFKDYPADKIANFLWRVGLPKRGIRVVLTSIGEPDVNVFKASPDIAAEYAACLIRVGAFEDAKSILEIPEVASRPRSALYMGYTFAENWEYSKAIQYFSDYIRKPHLPQYSKLVGMANLASSMIYEKEHEAVKPVLRSLLYDAQLNKNLFLLGYVLEIAAADKVLSQDQVGANKFLDEAEQRWKAVEGPDQIFLKKWRAIAKLIKKPDAKAIHAVEEVQREASSAGIWEAVRDCERYIVVATKDVERLTHLYFGTPYAAFRERLLLDFGDVELPKRYTWKLGENAKKQLHTSVLVDPKERMQLGLSGKPLALFSTLSRDFFRPLRLGTLFNWMQPDEHYDLRTTPHRVRESIRRLQGWFGDQKYPLVVEETGAGYRLVASRAFEIELELPESVGKSWRPLIVTLSEGLGNQPFSIGEAASLTHIPRRTLIRHLQSLVMSGHLIKTGTGPLTRYLVNREKASA